MKNNKILFIFLFLHLLAACASHVKPIVSLPEKTVSSDEKPFLGIGYSTIDNLKDLPIPDKIISKGLRITHIVPESAAHHAGLKIGDIIISYDTHLIADTVYNNSSLSFRDYFQTTKKIGDPLILEVIRKNTKMTSQQNDEKIHLQNIDSIKELVDKQPPGQQVTVSIDKEVLIRTIHVVLAAKPGIRQTPLPENKQLYPEFESIHDPYIDLSLNLIHDFHQQSTYEKILEQFDKDEQWDDGFRLNLFRYIHRNPLRAFTATDQTCNHLQKQIEKKELSELLVSVAKLLDEKIEIKPDTLPFPPKSRKDPKEHFRFIETAINTSLKYRNQAFKKITKADQQFLVNNLYDVLMDSDGSTFSMTDEENHADESLQKITALSHEINYSSLIIAAMILSRLADKTWLADFETCMIDYKHGQPISIPGVQGDILYIADTPAGKLIIGGKGPNRYDIQSGIIIDFGGDDIYLNGTANADGPGLSMIIDISGNDTYSATEQVSMGSGFLGIGMLIDLAGDDVYTGTSFSQGTGLMGMGMLADFQGNDHYSGQEYTQGVGLWGVGILLDRAGDDIYASTLMAQGVGGPKGVGVLSDMTGNDQYLAIGKHKNSYGSKGIFDGLSQGFGFGFRGYSSGGIGILMDSDGNDFFHAGNFSQGCGYAYGLGILKSAGDGDDRYLGSRYAQGCSAHSAAGILIDDGGNDHYSGTVGALQGAAWDMGLAVLVDRSGNDIYESRNLFFSQAAADLTGFAIFMDQGGTDQYGFTENRNSTTAHDKDENNLSLFIDNGGDMDQYNSKTEENNLIQFNNKQNLRIDLDGDINNSILNFNHRKLIRNIETD
ncbi:MAG: hypothetical protein C0403_06515 [Desulfobacterium sp.]|nr:hypothetical protein [Desulfobacterium sp.]